MLENSERMHSREIFVPKLPTVRTVALAVSCSPNLKRTSWGASDKEETSRGDVRLLKIY